MSNVVVLDMRAPHASDIADAAGLTGWRLVRVSAFEDMGIVAAHVAAAATGPIGELRLMSHGAPGEMQLGMGLTELSARQLAPIARLMRGGLLSSVWCFACHAGAATGPDKWNKSALLDTGFAGNAAITAGRGYRLLRALAQSLGTTTTAPVDMQFLNSWNYHSFFYGAVQFRGVSLQVAPSGAYRMHYPDGSATEERPPN